MAREPDKRPDALEEIRRRVGAGNLSFTIHGGEQMRARQIIYSDIARVLLAGEREEDRDRYEDKFRGWSYAMKGRTVDGEWLRVVVVFRDPMLLIVTAYFL